VIYGTVYSLFFSEDAEFDRGFCVNDPDFLGPQKCKKPVRLFYRDRHHNFDRLIRHVEEMDGMEAAMVAEPLGGADHRRAVNVHGLCLFHQPLRKELAVMATILLGKESDLKAIHCVLLAFHELRHQTIKAIHSNAPPDAPIEIAAIEFHIFSQDTQLQVGSVQVGARA
jgi:hypothetical protein